VKELFAQLNTAFDEFKTENNARLKQIEAKGHADPLLEKKVDNINTAISEIDAKYKARIDEVEAKANLLVLGGGMSDEDTAQAGYRKSFQAFARKGDIQAALSVGSDPDGGYSVPIEVDRAVLELERNEVTMRRLANVVALGTPNYSKIVNKGGASSGWVGETDARPTTTTPQLAALTPYWGEIYANPGATQQMLDDSLLDVEGWLASEVAMQFAAEENGKFLTGNGVLCPKGILGYTLVLTADATRAFGEIQYVKTAEAAAFKAASATVSPADCLIDVQQALKTAYRGNAKWLMNSATVGLVRKFKNAVQGDLIWQPGVIAGQPSTLLGKPIEEDEAMPSIGANNFPVLYGDFKRAYTIADRIGTRVLRDPYTAKPYVLFYVTKRVGGFLTDSNAVKAVKCEA
jgi:HK97 family phage major capsid protein